MIIRSATRADGAAIARLHIESWVSAYRGLLPDALVGPDLESHLTKDWMTGDWHRQDLVCVAEDDGKLLAFAALRPAPDASVLIDNLHVSPGSRNGGLGRAVLAHACGLWSPDAVAHLFVVEGNRRATAFYKRLGGQPNGPVEKTLLGHTLTFERLDWPSVAELARACAS